MIDRLHLRNFKCFEDEYVNLGGITLLAGLNGTGKSSVIQALLVLRQSGVVGDDSPSEYAGWGVRWQGSLVDVGSFRDVLHEGAADDTVGLKVSFDSTSCVEVNVRGINPEGHITEAQGFHGESESSLYRWSMFYLGADRLGPQKALPFFDQEHRAGTPLGAKGEHVLWFLGTRGGERVAETLCHPGEPTKTLAAQTNAWLKFISPGADLKSTQIPRIDLAFAGFTFARHADVSTRPFRAANVGFGLSYALPLVVSLLAARNDDLVIIENPEAHLHPGGQTKLAELAARAAAAGAQVILETHSDHVLDGVRLAVREAVVRPDQVIIHYFERDGIKARITTPEVDRDGRLDSWPAGFFDQQDRNLARLIAPRPSRDDEQ